MDDAEAQWTVGEVAAAAGVTVRTLHHYDRLGLLEPGERSGAGHRRYGAADLRRLYRILALRGLGFALGEIATLLDAGRGSLLEATRARLARVDEELAASEVLRGRLAAVLKAAEGSTEPGADQMIEAMEAMRMTVRLTRIYTGQGDAGQTRRADMSAVAKTDPVMVAGGDLDELNAVLGAALAAPDLPPADAPRLRRIQNDLFDLGAEVSAVPSARRPGTPTVAPEYVAWLEEVCDEVNAGLEPLDSFVLPGGGPYAAQLHVCRAVCRRAERSVLAAGEASPVALAYLNRLSDLLFILARAASRDEALWEPWERRASAAG